MHDARYEGQSSCWKFITLFPVSLPLYGLLVAAG